MAGDEGVDVSETTQCFSEDRPTGRVWPAGNGGLLVERCWWGKQLITILGRGQRRHLSAGIRRGHRADHRDGSESSTLMRTESINKFEGGGIGRRQKP